MTTIASIVLGLLVIPLIVLNMFCVAIFWCTREDIGRLFHVDRWD